MSADRQRTSVFEMREIARRSVRNPKATISPDAVDRYPHRDIDRLEAALDETGTVHGAAEDLDCTTSDIRRWADIYGLSLPEGGEIA